MRRYSSIPILCICLLAVAVLAPVMADVLPPKYRIEPILKGLTAPQAVAMAPDGRIFLLERTTGMVRIVENGKLLADTFVTVAVPASSPEGGLLGIALHPDFANTRWVFLYYTKTVNGKNRIERYTANGNTGIAPLVILDDIGPATVGAGEDNGGGLVFGNDGALYAGIGVMENEPAAQNDGTNLGKIVKITFNADGSVALVSNYAKGFRNVASLSVNKNTGTLYATDNYDADDACDEVNVVTSGANYGWDIASCGDGNQQAPMQSVTPQTVLSAVASYTGSKFPTPKVCANDATKGCNMHTVCSNDPKKPCWADMVCSNNSNKACTHNKVCSDNPTIPCTTNANCSSPATCIDYCGVGATCVPYCGTGNSCVPSCGWQVACNDQATQPVFMGGQGNGRIIRDGLSGAAYETMASTGFFYDPANDPSAANCPTGIRDLEVGADGWLYAAASDANASKAGLYRLLYDDFGAGSAKPREVSGSRYLQMTLAKDGGSGGVKLWWEDLKGDAWGCSSGHCPTGSKATKYTVWSGPLVTPFGYGHTALTETDGVRENDALLSYTQTSMPSDSRYYLVSARGANLEGTLGTRSDGVTERPGYAQSDLCNVIGYGTNLSDTNKCSQDWARAYPDQDNRLWKLSDFRGKAVVLSFGQYG